MIHDSLADVVATPLPDGLIVRPFETGDAARWLAIQSSTGIYDAIPGDLFEREFGDRPDGLPGRQLFARDTGGVDVATATAWYPEADRSADMGRIHWVAVCPEVQRRGIGRALTGIALERLRALGYRRAYLTTGAGNAAAVALYLDVGFRPEPRRDAERPAWQALAKRLGLPRAERIDRVLRLRT